MAKGFPLLLPATLLLLAASCSKEAGEGGLASIRGRVYARDFDKNGFLKTEGYAGDVRVSIGVLGEGTAFEDTRTSFDGSYEFPFLRKGTYHIWAYSQCDTCALEQVAVMDTVTISSRKEDVDAGELRIDM